MLFYKDSTNIALSIAKYCIFNMFFTHIVQLASHLTVFRSIFIKNSNFHLARRGSVFGIFFPRVDTGIRFFDDPAFCFLFCKPISGLNKPTINYLLSKYIRCHISSPTRMQRVVVG